MSSAEEFADDLRRLRAAAGDPSFRQLAGRTAQGKTTVSDAFIGRRLPTWPVARALVVELGGDEEEYRGRWAKAKNAAGRPPEVPQWLTSVRSDIPDLVTGADFATACALASSDPKKALASAWEVVRLSAVQISHALYDDLPGNWSSNMIASLRRAEEDGFLPAGTAAAANAVHHVHVPNTMLETPEAPTHEILQVVFLAYRLAWQAHDVVKNSAAARAASPPQPAGRGGSSARPASSTPPVSDRASG
ncbi:helix-turn-helix domain-containing protein [Streptomyces sp. NBC_01476]|uniref:helix-turn-helix domain-containing protein n=1 Tax=Streptomyces sp. NBC_01476 TaxID=2903881 RepID=UPI002E32D5CE|nr:helix-turn-helix transcriptional regulator [Streptomyces sp. NBC_01476]